MLRDTVGACLYQLASEAESMAFAAVAPGHKKGQVKAKSASISTGAISPICTTWLFCLMLRIQMLVALQVQPLPALAQTSEALDSPKKSCITASQA